MTTTQTQLLKELLDKAEVALAQAVGLEEEQFQAEATGTVNGKDYAALIAAAKREYVKIGHELIAAAVRAKSSAYGQALSVIYLPKTSDGEERAFVVITQ